MQKERVTLWEGLCGLIIGATMIIPGVSGGSMAMILGIYDKLIHAVNHIRTDRKQAGFLFVFVLGAGTGMLLFSTPLSWLLENYPMPVSCFFMGAVLGGVPMIVKKSGRKLWNGTSMICIMTGFLIVLLISLIPANILQGIKAGELRYQASLILLGIPASAALVLPGISVSHFFLIMGLYDDLMTAIRNMDFFFLFPLGAGIVLGIVLTAKLLEYVITHYPGPTYLVILGFILGSMMEIFPGVPTGIGVITGSFMLLTGFAAVYSVSRMEYGS